MSNDDSRKAELEVGSGDPYIDSTVADRYRIIRRLGQGGMGVVYLAEHVFIEKMVALKILSEDFARKPDLVARFMQEAKAASKIGHENIVDITDFGETPSGSVFFAMEFLDGKDLAQQVREGNVSLKRTRHIINQICRALGAAHGKGIIHRDMKPENVYLITREGKGDFVKILDFGIAKISGLEEAGSRLTRTGMIFGTPEYMSPEQARGDRPDHRVDIYAVGCILYEMLTGDVPFHADTFMGVLTKHMFDAPEPPSRRAPSAMIPPDVEAVVMKALSKDRDQRFQTMKEMALALESCDGGDIGSAWGNEPSGVTGMPGLREPSQSFKLRGPSAVAATVSPTPVPAEEPIAPARSKSRRFAVIGGVALVLGGGALAAVTWSQQKPPPPAVVVEPPPAKVVQKAPEAPVVSPPLTPAKAKTATMTVNTRPGGAEVWNGTALVGKTPCSVDLTSSSSPLELTLKKKGYRDQPLRVVPDKDHDYLVDLLPAAKAHATAKAPLVKVTAPPATPTAKPPEAKTEPAPDKSTKKLRDLKDPFPNQ